MNPNADLSIFIVLTSIGIVRKRTWTKLESTAYAGHSQFTTSEEVDFAPGELLVLSGTGITMFSDTAFSSQHVHEFRWNNSQFGWNA